MSQYGPTIGGAGGQTAVRLGYRAFAVTTLVSGIWFISIVPAVSDSWRWMQATIPMFRPDPEEMD